ncbi:protein transport protein Sec31A isoform X2 [Nilaparvata lugens]|uniref:protein transport protein Sec31A isoform X2 n=1 Tax=Nilaparvata lugens TaxID=108931 RepID=UPI00193E54AE|nr:protein transport protein Sec31A isoform X2 [Nilaparvata lugens]
MKVKELDRTVTLAWSPKEQHPVLLATGTAAQQLDASFSTSASLELYGLNLSEPGLDLELKATTASQARFHRIVWGGWNWRGDGGAGGVIVGGCDGGRLQIYNAAKLLAGEESLLAVRDTHTGPVRGLDFNSYQTNLLASGASESEIFIWDLNNTNTPMTPGAKSQPNDDVLWLAWNKQVQHILASAFATRCVVWDLRKNEPIMKLSDSNSRVRWKVLEWHPDIATQLCLASEDDSNPVVQLWDLRFASTPIKTMERHTKGVLSLAWCPKDPDLLMSSGKDSTIYCWNPNTNDPGGEVVCEMMTTYQWNFEVAWCPRNPSLIASCSFDGHASIYSLTGGQQHVQTSKKIADSFPGMEYAESPPVHTQMHNQMQSAAELRKAPKWLKKTSGVSFGFGGKLVTFSSDAHSVVISQVISEPWMVERSSELQSALTTGDYGSICSKRDDPIWPYISATLEPCPKAAMKRLLGFQPPQKFNKFDGEPVSCGLQGDMDRITDGIGSLNQDPNSENFLSNSVLNLDGNLGNSFAVKKSFTLPTSDDVDGSICKALLVGSIDVAVDLCLQENRMADALVLAMTAGTDLLLKTQARYFQQSKGQLCELIGAVVTEDWTQVVTNCNLDSWKEALAAVLTHSKNEQLPGLCETLGNRLENEGGEEKLVSAEICYIAANNLSRLIKLRTRKNVHLPTDKLQELVEMIVVMQRGVSSDDTGAAGLLTHYAELLASQGDLSTALNYVHGSHLEKPAELYDRLACALGQKTIYAQNQSSSYPYQQQNQLPGYGLQQQTSRIRRYSNQSTSSWSGQPNTPLLNQAKPQPAAVSSQQPPLFNMQQRNTAPAAPVVQPPSLYNPAAYDQMAPPPLIPAAASTDPYSPQQPSLFTPQLQQAAPPPMPPTGPPPTVRNSPSPAPSLGRSKYIPDPSVSGNAMGMSYRNQMSSAPVMHPSQPNPGLPDQQQPQPPYNNAVQNFRNQSYIPQQSGPAGWNDPPAFTGPPKPKLEHENMSAVHGGNRCWRRQQKVEVVPQAPITHPLFGAAPQQPINHYQQSQMGMMNGNYNDQMSAAAPPPVQMAPVQQPQQQQQQQQQQYGGVVAPPYVHQAAQAAIGSSQAPAPVAKAVEPPKPKPPIPDEHRQLQSVFDELRNQCSSAANNPQSKRKLEEVARKLEMLYDALRDSKLSTGTLSGLHELAKLVDAGDYAGGLGLHTQLISGPDFSQIASFMPGLKVLLQSALQLGVYLH